VIGTAVRRWKMIVGGGDPGGAILIALVLATAVVGCTSANAPGASRVQEAIEAANPGCGLERESRLALGGWKMAVVKALVRLSGDSEAAEVLPNILRVEAATYRVLTPALCARRSWTEILGEEMRDRGWRPMLVERGGSGSNWAFFHGGEKGEVDGLLVVGFGVDELEVVRIDGRIDRVLAERLAENAGTAGFMAHLSR